MAEASKPKAKAMLICDSVITERGTNKKSLIGVFESINALKFPHIHHFLAVYTKITEARGSYKFRLELMDLQKNIILGKGEIPENIVLDNPLGTHELVFNLGGLKFVHPGEYEFRIFANDKIFEQKAFLVKQIPGRGY